tara:strand:+ start:737 stop:1279 length:543 start_codon:yes stop_codon:yes gene_type:complete
MKIQLGRIVKKLSKRDKTISVSNLNNLIDIVNTLRTFEVSGSGCSHLSANVISGISMNVNKGISEDPLRMVRFYTRLVYTSSGVLRNVVKVNEGSVRIHNVSKATMSESEVTLTGDPEWIYIWYPRAGGTPEARHASTEPESTNTHLLWPLAKYQLNYRGHYVLGSICHLGDINTDTPIL